MFMSTLTPAAPLSLYMIAIVETTSTRVAVHPPWSVPPQLVCSSSTRISHTTLPGLADNISTWKHHICSRQRKSVGGCERGKLWCFYTLDVPECLSLPFSKHCRSVDYLPFSSKPVLLYLRSSWPCSTIISVFGDVLFSNVKYVFTSYRKLVRSKNCPVRLIDYICSSRSLEKEQNIIIAPHCYTY